MPNAVFLIGPSQIGKSTAGSFAASTLSGAIHHDLDADLKPFGQPGVDPVLTAQDWSIVEPLLRSYEASAGSPNIVDVGAGTQNMVEGGKMELVWWLGRPAVHVVLLTAEPSFAWERWIEGRPHMERLGFRRFVEQEFKCREPLYAMAQATIDVTGRAIKEVGDALVKLLDALA